MTPIDPIKAVVATRLSRCPDYYTQDALVEALQRFDELEELAQALRFQHHNDDEHAYPVSLLCVHLDLKEVIRWLPLRQRKAVVLHLVEGLTEAETAEALHINREFLAERLRGGLVNLRHLLNSVHHPLRDRGVVVSMPRPTWPVIAPRSAAPPDGPRGG